MARQNPDQCIVPAIHLVAHECFSGKAIASNPFQASHAGILGVPSQESHRRLEGLWRRSGSAAENRTPALLNERKSAPKGASLSIPSTPIAALLLGA